jgi:hypothetical protein
MEYGLVRRKEIVGTEEAATEACSCNCVIHRIAFVWLGTCENISDMFEAFTKYARQKET